jgi:hypothetical protein
MSASSEGRPLPHFEVPRLKIRPRLVESMRGRHQRTYGAALKTFHRMRTMEEEAQPGMNEKLHVAVAVKLKGVPEIITCHNDQKRHAEENLAITLLRMKQDYDRRGEPFPKIQSMSLLGAHAGEQFDERVLPERLSIHEIPEGTPFMCEKCIRVFRRLLKELYPVASGHGALTEATRDQRTMLKKRNFQMTVALSPGVVVQTNFETAPVIPFPGSNQAKSASEVLGVSRPGKMNR